MAQGDKDDMLRRLVAVLPARWWANVAPIRDAILGGIADSLAWAYGLLVWVKAQTRILTCSGTALDLVAHDYFGLRFRRRAGEDDDPFRARVLAEIVRPRATRAAIIKAVNDTAGREAYLFFEPANPTDTGGYGLRGGMGYSCAGRYGSLNLPAQAFIIPLRPPGQGIPNVQGYQTAPGDPAIGGLGAGAIKYARQADMVGPVTDSDIYAAIRATKPAGTVIWTAIESQPPEAFLDLDFHLDQSPLS